jgi:hypothetical protein
MELTTLSSRAQIRDAIPVARKGYATRLSVGLLWSMLTAQV